MEKKILDENNNDGKVLDLKRKEGNNAMPKKIKGAELVDLEQFRQARLRGLIPWETTVPRNIASLLSPSWSMPIIPYDQVHFRKDMYQLANALSDPDKLITLLHEFNNTYVWPAVCISLVTFPDPKDLNRFELHYSTSKSALPTLKKLTKEDWGFEDKTCFIRWLLSTYPEDLSYINLSFAAVYVYKNDFFEKSFSKAKDNHAQIDAITAQHVPDMKNTLKREHFVRTLEIPSEIQGAIIIPLYSKTRALKGLVHIGYPRDEIMQTDLGFRNDAVMDMQVLAGILSLCLE